MAAKTERLIFFLELAYSDYGWRPASLSDPTS
jgi:hypothetical protein